MRQQRIGPGQVVRLTRRQQKAQRIAERVDQRMDLAAQTAATAAEGLVLSFFERAGAVLMSPHDGAVDHRVLVIAIGGQVLKDALPYTGFRPAAEPPVRILPVAEALRQVAPWYSRTIPVQHRLDKATIVLGGCADIAQLTGKQVLDPFPLVVAK